MEINFWTQDSDKKQVISWSR